MAIPSKSLVVDASVARAAGGEGSVHPVGATCRKVLQEILSICHKAVMSPEIQAEWNRHQSSFAKQWRSGMVARKKLILVADTQDSNLRGAIVARMMVIPDRNAVLKDCHLIEAALQADNRIVSLDARSRFLFGRAAPEVPAVGKIAWIDPADPAEDVISWLRQGAPLKGRTF